MKRSTQIGLTAAGLVLVAAMFSSGDDDAREDLVFDTLDDCKKSGTISTQQCETVFAEATAKRLQEAPKFASRNECEAQYGGSGCSAATIGGTQYFLPALAGFMLARSLGGGAAAQGQPLLPPTRAACPPGSTQPECQQARSSSSSSSIGGSRGSGSRAYSTTSGQALVSRSSTSSRASTPGVSSRGGFGSTSRSFFSSSSS